MFANPISLEGCSRAVFSRSGDVLGYAHHKPLSIARNNGSFVMLRPHAAGGQVRDVAVALNSENGLCAILNDSGTAMVLSTISPYPACLPVFARTASDACAVAVTADGGILATGDESGLVRIWHYLSPQSEPFNRHVSLRRITSMTFDRRGWLYACDVTGRAFCLAGVSLQSNGRFVAARSELIELNGPDGFTDNIDPDFEAFRVVARPDRDEVLLVGLSEAYMLRIDAVPVETGEGEEWKQLSTLVLDRSTRLQPQLDARVLVNAEFVSPDVLVLFDTTTLQTWRADESGDFKPEQYFSKPGYRPTAAQLVPTPAGQMLNVAMVPQSATTQDRQKPIAKTPDREPLSSPELAH